MRLGSRFLIFGFVILCFFRVYSVITGADSLVSVEPLTNFPAADSDNEILDFAFMKSGFSFQDATTSCTFKAVFPVAGNVTLRGGTLYLDTDLIFQNPANLISSGYFFGNSHQLDLSASITWLSSTNHSQFRNMSIFLNNDFTIAGTVKCLGSCLLDGRLNNITLGQNANVVIGHNATLTLRNMEIDGILGYKIKCLDDTANLILDNVRWVQSGDYTFTRGAISFVNEVDIAGQHKFNFSPTRTSTIATDSMLHFDIGTTFSYSPQVPKRTLLFMNDATSLLSLDSCSLVATRTGLALSNGTLVIDNHVTFSSQARFWSEGIEFKNTLNTLFGGGATLDSFGVIIAS